MRGTVWQRAERRLRRVVPADRIGAVLAELLDDYDGQLRQAGRLRADLWLLVESRSLVRAYQQRHDGGAVRFWPWWQSVAQDLAYAVRSLRRQPSFALVPMGALAIAIGIAVSLFTVFNAVILQPWPVKDPGRVVAVFAQTADGADGLSAPEYQYLADHATTLSGISARGWDQRVYIGDEAIDSPLYGVGVSRNFFDVMGASMAFGRGLSLTQFRGRFSYAA